MKRIAVLSIAIAVTITSNLFAVGEARLTGVVTDPQGDPLSNVVITVSATEKMTFEKQFETDEEGRFSIFLLDGTIPYRVTFEKEGFATFEDVLKLDLLPQQNHEEIVLGAERPAESEASEDATSPAYVAYNEGVELANAKENAAAIEKFEESVTIDPELSAGWGALTRVYARTGQWEKTVEAGEKTLDLVGEDEVIASLLADAYAKLGNEEMAQKYRRMSPANPAILFNEAVPHLNENRDEEAEQLLKQAVSVDDTFAKAHYELGSLYARQGKNEEAKKHLTRYLELEPNGEDAPLAREMVKYLE
ncbi:MAG: tetratricopeptide repeat protein [Thermoanaerobaculia bacterium]|nr:tetratricopeptide repeat protein [Thermoanaerobaculia bacterium]